MLVASYDPLSIAINLILIFKGHIPPMQSTLVQ